MPPIFVCLFTHVFLPLFCCIRLHFSSFFLNFHIFGLVWNYFGEYSIGGACSTQLEEGEVAAQRATDDDDQRQWKRDQTSFWQTSTYLTYLPTWTSRAKEHHFFSPFEIWSVKAKSPPNENQFSIFFLSWRWGQKPAKQNRFFQRVFPRKKMFFNSICLRFCCLFIILLKPQRLAVSRSL